MLHFPGFENYLGFILYIVFMSVMIAFEINKNHKTIKEAIKNNFVVIVFYLFCIFILESIGIVWYLALAIVVATILLYDYLHDSNNDLEKDTPPQS